MNSILGQLLVLTSPFFAAVASGKKRATKKSVKKRVAAKPKRLAKAKPKKTPARAKPARARKPTASIKKKSERKPVAPTKQEPARKGAPAKPEPRKGTLPAKPEPKVVAPPPPKPVRPAGRPILLSPENGKYADSVNPKFRWLSVGSATRYEVIWSQDPNLINGYSVVSVSTEAAVPVEKPLAVGVIYYWHVRGGNEAGWGPWSMAASFSVLEEEANA